MPFLFIRAEEGRSHKIARGAPVPNLRKNASPPSANGFIGNYRPLPASASLAVGARLARCAALS